MLVLACRAGCDVEVVHVDHGQRPNSAHDALVVEAASDRFGARFSAESVVVVPGANLEARLRAARYGVLGSDAATAHTLDDQAETVLINLMRGAGLAGLGAMRPGVRRPLLGLRRRDTEEICANLDLQPLHDPANDDPRFVRNRVRHELIPTMNAIAGRDVVPLLCRTAEISRSAAQLVEEMASSLDATDTAQLRAAPRPVAAAAVQRWISDQTGTEHAVGHAAIERVLRVVAGEVVAAEVPGGHRIARSNHRLELQRSPK